MMPQKMKNIDIPIIEVIDENMVSYHMKQILELTDNKNVLDATIIIVTELNKIEPVFLRAIVSHVIFFRMMRIISAENPKQFHDIAILNRTFEEYMNKQK